MEVTRRNLIQILGAAPAAAQQLEHPHTTPAEPPRTRPYQRKIFDDRQWKTVRVLCDLILPADERSGGATAAGVPEYIDDWLDFRKREDGTDVLAAQIQGGLAWLDHESRRLVQKDFVLASAADQKKILDRVAWPAQAAAADHVWVNFFNVLRDLTVAGFFSSKTGVADLPYLGNRPVAEWKGCDPKTWQIIEERMKNGYKGVGGESKPFAG